MELELLDHINEVAKKTIENILKLNGIFLRLKPLFLLAP